MAMIRRVISQPWSDAKAGDELLSALREPFSTLHASIGFVNASGVRHVAAGLEEFRGRGGYVRFVVGVDGEVTSETGVRALRRVVDELYVFRHPGRPLFHPKTYLFKSDHYGLALIGSANLTESGLWVNYEDLVGLDFDLHDPADLAQLDELFRHHDQLRASPNAHLADDRTLKRIKAMGLLPDELERRRARHRRDVDIDRGAAEQKAPKVARAMFPHSAVSAPPAVPLLPEEEARAEGATRPRPKSAPSHHPLHSVFTMRLGKRDAGSQAGFSPDVFIPIAAWDADRGFWGVLVANTTPDGNHYDERQVSIEFRRLDGDVDHDTRRLYYYERKSELRLNARQVHEDSEAGDLMTLELAPPGLDIEYVVRVIKPTDPLYARYDEMAANSVPNSDKRWGYGG